jgi:membrane protein
LFTVLGMRKKAISIYQVLRSTVKLYMKHDTSTLGAALSYYMVFSIAPVIIIIISLVGAILGPHAVQGEIKDQLQDFLGNSGATQLENVIKTVYHPGKSVITTILATILLIMGATSVFGQMRTSLNIIWEVKPHAKKPWIKFILNRIFSFGMIVCVAFLLLVSLVFHAVLVAFTQFLNEHFSGLSVWMIRALDHALSVGGATVMFAFVYKFLSDAKLKWTGLWEGAVFTAVLFVVGKHFIGMYIGHSGVTTTYGAVGSGVMILAWVYYSSQLVFFGAEFTRALAMHRGNSLDPEGIESHEEAASIAQKHLAEA